MMKYNTVKVSTIYSIYRSSHSFKKSAAVRIYFFET